MLDSPYNRLIVAGLHQFDNFINIIVDKNLLMLYTLDIPALREAVTMLTNDWYYFEQYIPERTQTLQSEAHIERVAHLVPVSPMTWPQKIRIRLGYLLIRAGYRLMKPRICSDS